MSRGRRGNMKDEGREALYKPPSGRGTMTVGGDIPQKADPTRTRICCILIQRSASDKWRASPRIAI